MASFPTPARPRPGRFPFGTRGLVPQAEGEVSVRVALVYPAAGRISVPGETVEFASALLATSGALPADRVKWQVSVYREAREAAHPHFWHEREAAYRVLTRELAPGEPFRVAAEEAERGYSTWSVSVHVFAGTVLLGAGTAVFALEIGVVTVPGYLLDIPWPAVPAEAASRGAAVTCCVEASPAALIAFPMLGCEATPGVLLDPTPGI